MVWDSLLARLLAGAAVAAAVLALDGLQRPHAAVPARAQMAAAQYQGKAVDAASLRRADQGDIPMPPGAAAAHASSLLVMPAASPQALTVFWFSGERESGPLVQIAASQLDRASQVWSEPRLVVNRHTVGAQLGYGIRRLGNPVAWLDAQGRIHLFVVATGWGGWAASRVLHLQQESPGQSLAELRFAPQRVLPLSWLFNTSFLVRNAPLPLADGGMVLPVYFELGVKFPAALRFAADGRFLGMVRMSRLHHLLQPTLLAQGPQQWVALLRDTRPDGRIAAVQTVDGGQHWSDLPDLPLQNPDAAVAALALGPGQMVLAHNPQTQGRNRLELSRSAEGLRWTRVETLALGLEPAEFSYPALAWVDDSLWITYTVDRRRLAWQRFAPARGLP